MAPFFIKSEFLIAVRAFWDVTACRLIDWHQGFGGTLYFHHCYLQCTTSQKTAFMLERRQIYVLLPIAFTFLFILIFLFFFISIFPCRFFSVLVLFPSLDPPPHCLLSFLCSHLLFFLRQFVYFFSLLVTLFPICYISLLSIYYYSIVFVIIAF